MFAQIGGAGCALRRPVPSGPIVQTRRIEMRYITRETGAFLCYALFGGNKAGDRTTEGASGAAYLSKHGIPDSALVAVPTGSNTYRSLVAARDVMKKNGWTSAVIVSDPWHALRARTMADDLGIDAHVSPVTSGPIVQTRRIEMRYIARETGAFLCYALFGGKCEPGPAAA